MDLGLDGVLLVSVGVLFWLFWCMCVSEKGVVFWD